MDCRIDELMNLFLICSRGVVCFAGSSSQHSSGGGGAEDDGERGIRLLQRRALPQVRSNEM